MKSLLEPNAYAEILTRLEKLRPDITPIWGKMNSAQMLAHNSAALEYACGDWHGKQVFIGKLLAPFMKSNFYNDKPLPKNTPTAPQFIAADLRDFEKEKARLVALIKRFHSGGPEKVTTSPNMFYGKLTAEQWAIGMYKHLDHHFTQFGI